MMKKYPRTRHLCGSHFQHGDHDMEAVPWKELAGKNLVIEEKIDGANAGVSFTEKGELLLQSRGHYLRGGPRERHFDIFKQWASARQEELYCALGDRYVMYGEWMYAKHTVFYDALPHYFMEFDVFDTKTETFLSTDARRRLYVDAGISHVISPVLVLAVGSYKEFDDVTSLVGRSNFMTDERDENLRNAAISSGVDPLHAQTITDMSHDMEGLYIKWEEDGIIKGRYKYVRRSFTNKILDQEEHWLNRPIIKNGLVSGAYDNMFV